MDTFNYVSSLARSVLPRHSIPSNVFSLVIEYYGGAIEKVEFQLPPDQITESKGANFASEHVLGRFEPIRMYTNSDATRISFTVNYYWLEDSLMSNGLGTWNGIKESISKLRALLYPYDGGRASSTPAPAQMMSSVQQSAATSAQSSPSMDDTNVQNAYNQYVGKLSPPPIIKLNYGDLYKNFPCILSGIQVDFKGPWNDAGLAAVSRRLAQFSRLGQSVNNTIQLIQPVSDFMSSLPQNPASKASSFISNLASTLTSDRVFPFCTTFSISLESAYPFGSQKTYNDVRGLGSAAKPLLQKIISNLPIKFGG